MVGDNKVDLKDTVYRKVKKDIQERYRVRNFPNGYIQYKVLTKRGMFETFMKEKDLDRSIYYAIDIVNSCEEFMNENTRQDIESCNSDEEKSLLYKQWIKHDIKNLILEIEEMRKVPSYMQDIVCLEFIDSLVLVLLSVSNSNMLKNIICLTKEIMRMNSADCFELKIKNITLSKLEV